MPHDKRRQLSADGGGSTYTLVSKESDRRRDVSARAQCRSMRRRAPSSFPRSRDREIAIEKRSCTEDPPRHVSDEVTVNLLNPARCMETPWFSITSKILHIITIFQVVEFTHRCFETRNNLTHAQSMVVSKYLI